MKLLLLALAVSCPPLWASPAFVRTNAQCDVTTATASNSFSATSNCGGSFTASTSGDAVLAVIAWKTVSRTINYVCSGASCTNSTTSNVWFPYTQPWCNTGTGDTCTQIWICTNCGSISTVVVDFSGTTISAVVFDEYSGVSAVGDIASTNATSTAPSESLTIDDGSDIVFMGMSASGAAATVSASTGNLRGTANTGSGTSNVAAAGCDNSSATAGTTVTCTLSITSTPWLVQAVELRGATAPSTYFVSSNVVNAPGSSETATLTSITGPMTPDPTLAGNTVFCAVMWPYSASQTVTVTDRNTMTGSTVDTFTNDKQVNDTSGQSLALFRAATTTGTNYINITFGTALAEPPNVTWACSQFTNIAITSPVDASSGTADESHTGGGTITAGSMMTSDSGDVIIYAVLYDGTLSAVSQGTGHCAPGYGFVLLASNLMNGVCLVYTVQSSSGSINPSLYIPYSTNIPSGTFNAVAVAYKTLAGQGTAASGAYIAHEQMAFVGAGVQTIYVDCPAVGNFEAVDITDISGGGTPWQQVNDTDQIHYSVNNPDTNLSPLLFYSAGSTLNNSSVCKVAQTSSSAGTTEVPMKDIAGINSSTPFDTSISCPSPSSSGTNGCYNADATLNAGSIANAPNITPNNHDLILVAAAIGTGPPSNLTVPSSAIFDVPWFTGMVDADTFAAGNGHGHYYATSSAALNFTWTQQGTSGAAATAFALLELVSSTGSCTVALLGAGPC